MTMDGESLDEAIADVLIRYDFVVAIADAVIRDDPDTAAALIREYRVLVDARRATLASAMNHGNHHTSQPSPPPPLPPIASSGRQMPAPYRSGALRSRAPSHRDFSRKAVVCYGSPARSRDFRREDTRRSGTAAPCCGRTESYYADACLQCTRHACRPPPETMIGQGAAGRGSSLPSAPETTIILENSDELPDSFCMYPSCGPHGHRRCR